MLEPRSLENRCGSRLAEPRLERAHYAATGADDAALRDVAVRCAVATSKAVAATLRAPRVIHFLGVRLTENRFTLFRSHARQIHDGGAVRGFGCW